MAQNLRKMANKSEITFEQALKRLEEITVKLENGALPLDESMKLYEEGVKLSDLCAKQLNEAELKIKTLSEVENGDDGE